MAGRKKLGNDPLQRRRPAAGECAPTGTRPASLETLLSPCPEGAPPQAPLQMAGSSGTSNINGEADVPSLQDVLNRFFPVTIHRESQEKDAQWLHVADEQFRRLALALPTLYGQPAFTLPQLQDLSTIIIRELVYLHKKDAGALSLTNARPASSQPVPQTAALLLLYGLFASVMCLLDNDQSMKDTSLHVHFNATSPEEGHEAHVGSPAFGAATLRCVEPGGAEDSPPRLLDRDKLWPCLEQLGFKLARHGCRLFLMSSRGAELRIDAPLSPTSPGPA